MNMQTVGQATPVLLLQTNNQTDNLRTRDQFSSDREFVRYLRKQLKDKAKKPEDKKGRTFSFWEVFAILSLASFPVAIFQVGLGYAVVKVFKILATQ